MANSKRPRGRIKSSGKGDDGWSLLIKSSSESTMLELALPSSSSVVNLYSLTVEPAELCAVILSTYEVRGFKSRTI